MPKLTDETRNRIARKILIHKMSQDGLSANKKALQRELPNAAKDMGEKLEDLEAFVKEIIPEVISAKLGCKAVSIDW